MAARGSVLTISEICRFVNKKKDRQIERKKDTAIQQLQEKKNL